MDRREFFSAAAAAVGGAAVLPSLSLAKDADPMSEIFVSGRVFTKKRADILLRIFDLLAKEYPKVKILAQGFNFPLSDPYSWVKEDDLVGVSLVKVHPEWTHREFRFRILSPEERSRIVLSTGDDFENKPWS